MSSINPNTQQVNANTEQSSQSQQVQQNQQIQQATNPENQSIKDFNKLLNSKRNDPAAIALLKKSEKMLANKSGILSAGEGNNPKLAKFSGKEQDLSQFKPQFSENSKLMPEQAFTQKDTQAFTQKDTQAFNNKDTQIFNQKDAQAFNPKDKDLQKNDGMPNADNLYASLNQSSATNANYTVQASNNVDRPQFDATKIQELADRILVATHNDGSKEVRLTLSDKALAGTEIIINKSVDNILTVRFETSNANSFQTLVAAQDALKSTLETQNSNVRVEVTQQRHDPQGESRGKREYVPEEELEA